MNLYEMLRKGDQSVVASDRVTVAESEVAGERWRGVHFCAPAQLEVVDARRFYSLRSQPDSCGWRVQVPKDMGFEIGFVDPSTNNAVSSWTPRVSSSPETVRLPWPKVPWSRFNLRLSVTGPGSGTVFLAVHRALSREWLYQEARGVGIELGPGPAPQIMPKEGVSVSYVEQMAADEWDRLYNSTGKFPRHPELWANYVIGDANSLPVSDGSLDFIFSSHVFEHLANPIGHLEHWSEKLRPGGKVLCVIPDLMGTKDALQTPSCMSEWIEEYKSVSWRPTLLHYARYFRQPPGSPTVEKAIRDQFSIHAHFYTNTNCQELLSFACDNLGYSSFDLEWTPNSKDFHFILRKG